METFVVGFDGSEPSSRALVAAMRFASELPSAFVRVVYARHRFLALPDDGAGEVETGVLDEAEATIRNQVDEQLGGCSVPWSFETRLGAPATVLCDAADEHAASAIVIGRAGWSVYQDVLLGSTAYRVVHRSSRPVLVVP